MPTTATATTTVTDKAITNTPTTTTTVTVVHPIGTLFLINLSVVDSNPNELISAQALVTLDQARTLLYAEEQGECADADKGEIVSGQRITHIHRAHLIDTSDPCECNAWLVAKFIKYFAGFGEEYWLDPTVAAEIKVHQDELFASEWIKAQEARAKRCGI